MRGGLAILVLCGCDVVLGLKEIPPTIDAPGPDGAPGCWSVDYQDNDEDKDGDMDGCDNCPIHSNATQTDDDRDGVGNACDPSPTIPHRIAAYRSFHRSSDMDGLVKGGNGVWTIANGTLLQTGSATGSIGFNAPFTAAIVHAKLEQPDASLLAGVGILASVNPAMQSQRLQCFARSSPMNMHSLHFERTGGVDDQVVQDSENNFGQQSIFISLEVAAATDNQPRCQFDTVEDGSFSLQNAGPLTGFAALYTVNSTGAFHHILVIVPVQ